MTVVTINPGDGEPDVAVLINATLNDPSVTEVVLGPGLFILHSPISVPSGKTLSGAGRDLTILRAAEDFDRPNPGEYDGVVNTDMGAVGVSLRDFSIDANKLMPDGFRLVGCFMRQATDFTVERVDVYNTTGYAHFAQGDANGFTVYASGTYEDCATYNASIGFEQMAADGITLTNIFAGDGDGDLVGTYFHPLTGSRNITYINAVAVGYADVGFELTANVRAMENIRIIDSYVEMLGGGSAIVVAGPLLTTGLEIINSSFIAHNNLGGMFYGTQGTAVDSYFQGEAIGVSFYKSPGGIYADFVATDTDVLGLRNTSGGGAAFGISASGPGVVWNGGEIEVRGAAMIPLSGPVALVGTPLIQTGYGAVTSYTENGAAKLIAPNLVVPLESLASLDGGSVTIKYLAKNMTADQLGIQDQGIGDNQIGFDGTNVTYEGTVIGTASGGAAGEDMVIALNASATAEAVVALVRAATFLSTSDTPTLYRPFEFHIVDGLGARAEANAIVSVTPVNDLSVFSLYAPGANTFLNYVENGAPAALAPTATVTDVDSFDFNTGSLKVEFTGNGSAADRLSILHQGTAAGQVGVAGNLVTYGGVTIGSFTGGTNGSTPLLITFNNKSTPAAVEAVTRAVAFSNSSDVPSVAARTISFTLSDGDGGSVLMKAKAYVLRTDDAPVAANDAAEVSENGTVTGNVLGNDSDVDGPAIQVTQVNGSAANVGQLIALASGATVQLNADGTYVYNPNGAFETLGIPGSAAPVTGTDSFTYRLAGGNTATVTVTIFGANDSPTLTLALGGGQPNVIVAENAAPGAIAPDAVVADLDSTNFDGGTLTVQFTGNGGADDRLSVLDQGNGAGQIGVAGNVISYEGIVIATYQGGTDGSTPLVVTFNGDSSLAAVEALARAVAFGNVSDAPSSATRTLLFTLTDGDGGSVQGIAKASVLETEDLAFATDDSAATDEDQILSANVLGNDGDPDGPAPQVAQVNGSSADVGQLITLASGATLQLNADGSYVYDPNGVFAYLVDPDSGAAGATSAVDSFTYALVGGAAATVTVTVGGVNLAGEILLGDSGDNDIVGAAFSDLFRLEQGGADSASGLDGDDIFYFGNGFGAGDHVDGGAGIDTIAIQGDYGGGLILGIGTESNMIGIESLSLLSGSNVQFGDLGGNLYDYVITTLDSNIAAGVQFKINGGNLLAGEDLTVDGSAETDGHFLIYGGKGIDLLTGGAGNDVFFFAHDGRLGAGDHIDGGAGFDGLFLRGNFTIDFNDAAYSDLVRNVENFTLTSVADTRYARSSDTEFDYDIITDDDLVAAGVTVTFNGGQLQANETMKLDASHETDGHVRIFAGAADDTLIGGAGNDLLYGGLGADLLDGGSGSDTLRYNSVAESTSLAHDVLVGFDYSVDKLDLAGTHDSFEFLVGGLLDSSNFDLDLAAAMTGVLDSNEAIFFTADSGDLAGSVFLVVDQNGIAGYQAGEDYVFDVTASPPPLGPIPDFIV